MSTKNITLRLPEESYFIVEKVAGVRQTSVSDVIRMEIDRLIHDVATDDDFRESLQRDYETAFEILDKHVE
jgi:hypothetical protein